MNHDFSLLKKGRGLGRRRKQRSVDPWDPAGCRQALEEGGCQWGELGRQDVSQRVRFPTLLHVSMKVEPNKFERIV